MNFNSTGTEEIVHANGVTQRRSIVGQLHDQEQAFPGGNPKLDYNRGVWFADVAGQNVYTFPDDEGVGIFFDAQLNPVDDVTAARAFGASEVARMKAKRRRLDLEAAATAKVADMMKAEKEAVQDELDAALAADAEVDAAESISNVKDLGELAADGERAHPVVKP
jgi:hypothetical protein